MKRGELSELQIEPRRYCPGDQLVLCAQQTDDLLFTIRDFSARAGGRSPSGIAMQPRSSSGSTARTVHYFNNIRSEERRVGKECVSTYRSRGSPFTEKNTNATITTHTITKYSQLQK